LLLLNSSRGFLHPLRLPSPDPIHPARCYKQPPIQSVPPPGEWSPTRRRRRHRRQRPGQGRRWTRCVWRRGGGPRRSGSVRRRSWMLSRSRPSSTPSTALDFSPSSPPTSCPSNTSAAITMATTSGSCKPTAPRPRAGSCTTLRCGSRTPATRGRPQSGSQAKASRCGDNRVGSLTVVDTTVMMAIFTEVKGKVNHSGPNLHLATQSVLASTTCHKNFS